MQEVYQRPPTDSVHGSSSISGPAAPAGEPSDPRTAMDAPTLTAEALMRRIDEEIGRADRQGTALCCLLVQIGDFAEISDSYGPELAERALCHAGDALHRELRRFDRVGRPRPQELLVVLPGAGQAQGEAVARRALRRLRAIKIEVGRLRRPLACSVGIAAWQAPWDAAQMLEQTRRAAGSARNGNNDAGNG